MGMSLVIGLFSSTDVVLVADTMGVVVENGKESTEFNHDKIILVNPYTAIGVAGGFMEEKFKQFLQDFTYAVRYKSEFNDIFKRLCSMLQDSLKLQEKEYLQLIVVGYKGKQPVAKMIFYYYGSTFKTGTPTENFILCGIPECVEYAKELLKAAEITSTTAKSKLEVVAKEVVEKSIAKFPEKLGGEVKPKILAIPG